MEAAAAAIQTAIDRRVRERQQLREAGADAETLEQNRREIVRLQLEFANALLGRYAVAEAA
jgi:hypothetical protein